MGKKKGKGGGGKKKWNIIIIHIIEFRYDLKDFCVSISEFKFSLIWLDFFSILNLAYKWGFSCNSDSYSSDNLSYSF